MPRKRVSLEAKVDIWLPLYISDNGSDTAHLTGDEYRAYMQMQKHQWRHGHMSPEDMANLSLMGRDAWSKSQARFEQAMSSDENGNFFFQKLEELRDEWITRRVKAQEKARNAAIKRHSRKNEGETGDAPSIPQATPVADLIPEKGGIKGCPSPLTSKGKDSSPSASPPGKASAEKAGAGVPGGSPAAAMGSELEKSPAAGMPDAAKKLSPAGRGRLAISPPVTPPRLPNPTKADQHGTLSPKKVHKGNRTTARNGDPRAEIFEHHLRKFYAAVNGVDPGDVPFGPKERSTLSAALKAEPHLTEGALSMRLKNRIVAIRLCEAEPKRRGKVNRRDPLTTVIGRLAPYADGPVDAFNQPM